MVDAIEPLYTAHGTAIGGAQRPCPLRRRNRGPRSLGAEGDGRARQADTGTPEHLFAAGYAACFGGALDFIAKQHKKDASKATVKCAVSIGPREKGGFGLAVVLDVTDAVCRKVSFSRWRKRRTRRSAPIATPPAATSTSRSSRTARSRGRNSRLSWSFGFQPERGVLSQATPMKPIPTLVSARKMSYAFTLCAHLEIGSFQWVGPIQIRRISSSGAHAPVVISNISNNCGSLVLA